MLNKIENKTIVIEEQENWSLPVLTFPWWSLCQVMDDLDDTVRNERVDLY